VSLGICGKILRVDLSSGQISVDEPSEKFYRTYFGGTGFSSYFLLTETKPGVDPLSPENILIFSAGPLTGVALPGSGRHGVGAKSPLTNAFGDSQAGGFWGAELKKAGFDALIVKGASEHPVYLIVKDGDASLKDARELWGLPGAQCINKIHQELSTEKVRVAYIGPGGENLVKYACVGHDLKAFAGRCGLGAVMGSKRLKAVAVMGSGSVPVADMEGIRNLTRWLAKNRLPGTKSLTEYGTARILPMLSDQGGCPTYNFRDGSFEHIDGLTGEAINKTILKTSGRCFACPIACKRVVEAESPYLLSSQFGGPEYETIASFGSNCGISSISAVARANQLCSDYGLDTISTGVSISFAMECYEAGLLTKEDTGGLELTFGNEETLLKVIELIAYRRGVGDLLAEGVKRAAETIGRGAEHFAMHVKGQEVPMHEPRFKPGLGVGYAVSPTGADHIHNLHDTAFTTEQGIADLKAFGLLEPVRLRDLGPKKIKLAYYFINWRHFLDSLAVCVFVPWSIVNIVDLVTYATGWNTSAHELLKVGERACTMARMFNIREGFTKEDDVMPKRLFKPFSSGPLEGVAIKEEEFNQAIKYYYEFMGWNEDGVPKDSKLYELGIHWAKKYLGPSGSL
jgi:aldehyde:ferredoxin oxidoreductase